MNELTFFFHILAMIGFVLISLRLGERALIALIALQAVFANLFVVKQISLFGLFVTCSDVFAVGTILALNLLQEYFGKERAKQAVKISLIALIFLGVMSQIHLLYAPIPLDTAHASFAQIFSSSPRILFASLFTFFLVQQLDVSFFSHLKGKLPIRIATSLVLSQFLDTVLFSFLGLYGLVESVSNIIIVSFAIKCLIILLSSPFTLFAKRFVKHELSL